jgi:hypothetical protein
MSAIAFALSRYRVPKVIEEIAAGYCLAQPMENKQRMGIQLSEMEKWGLWPDNFEDGMLYLTLEAYLHPKTIENTIRMFDTCNWWENSFLNDFKPYRGLLKMLGRFGVLPPLARFLERDVCRNTREEVNIYTYKTADYMLSTAQDYRKGYGGDQQHIWQATLGADAVCFTTHPARIEGVTPNYWAGNGLLPRAAQYRNVMIAVYNIKRIPALYVPIKHFFTHAWLPKDKFDEVIEKNGWVFARKGDGYLALRSQNPYFWNEETSSPSRVGKNKNSVLRESPRLSPEDVGREVIVDGAHNIWICQMGRKADDGGFLEFVDKLSRAEVVFSGMNVQYRSPGNGVIRFGWEGALRVDGVEVQLDRYQRYDNPHAKAEFDPSEILISAGGHQLRLNWQTGERKAQ